MSARIFTTLRVSYVGEILDSLVEDLEEVGGGGPKGTLRKKGGGGRWWWNTKRKVVTEGQSLRIIVVADLNEGVRYING